MLAQKHEAFACKEGRGLVILKPKKSKMVWKDIDGDLYIDEDIKEEE